MDIFGSQTAQLWRCGWAWWSEECSNLWRRNVAKPDQNHPNLPACSECRDFMRCPYFFAGAPCQVPQHEHQPEGQLSHKPAHELEQLMHLHLLVIENIILTSQGSEGSHRRGISHSQWLYMVLHLGRIVTTSTVRPWRRRNGWKNFLANFCSLAAQCQMEITWWIFPLLFVRASAIVVSCLSQGVGPNSIGALGLKAFLDLNAMRITSGQIAWTTDCAAALAKVEKGQKNALRRFASGPFHASARPHKTIQYNV